MSKTTLPLWAPSPSAIQASQLTHFIAKVIARYPDHSIDHYSALYQWSIDFPEQFWPEVIRFCDVIIHTPWCDVMTPQTGLPPLRWFNGCTLNYAENLLRHTGDHIAVDFYHENGEQQQLSWSTLRTQVAQLAEQLRTWGIGVGDRVVGYCPNRPETLIAMLASTSLGAIWSSCSMDFGYNGALERFGQISPRVLFAADGHIYNGCVHPSQEKLTQLQASLPSVEHTVLINNIGSDRLANTTAFSDCLKANIGEADLRFEPVAFDHPLFIMFSSGTTGAPKCIVHGHGGTLLQHRKEHVLHTDLRQTDAFFYFTTCGWMMWNWLASGLANGSRIVLYEGAPLPKHHPTLLIDLIDQAHINIFGTSAKFLTALEKTGTRPIETHKLDSLRCVLSTGSPLVPQNYRYVYQSMKQDVRLSSISGGTDIISCFALGNPNLPVHIGELQCRGLGMRVEIFNPQGQSVRGEKGELVCSAPFPSMPICFWNDPDGSKYRHAYFDKFPGVWAHGDFAELTAHDGLIIYGRSDTVLNPGGVRIGTAEIYRAVEKIDDITESIAIGLPLEGDESDEQIVLFVVLKPGAVLDDALIQQIKTRIKTQVSPHHVPRVIKAVPDIPRTISGKIVELAVRKVARGEPVDNIEALANPEALEYYRGIIS